MIGDDGLGARRLSQCVGQHGTDKYPGHPQRRRTLMALQASGAAVQFASAVERVENRTLARVERGNLDAVAAGNIPHSNVVVEIDGARILRRDFRGLEAGFRKHQRLGIGTDIELPQQFAQRFNPGSPETRDPVLGGGIGVADGRMFEREIARITGGEETHRRHQRPTEAGSHGYFFGSSADGFFGVTEGAVAGARSSRGGGMH